MELFIWLISGVCLSWFMSYHKSSLSTYTWAMGLLMVIGSLFDVVSLFGWILFSLIALPINIDDFRKNNIRRQYIKIRINDFKIGGTTGAVAQSNQ